MKLLVLTLSFLTSASALACLGEAQIIAGIARVEKTGIGSCKAFVDSSKVRFFAESGVCPLDLSEVLQAGVAIGTKDGHDCALDAGQELNGVVVKNQAGVLHLE